MPIIFLQPLSAGNAVRVFISSPAGAKSWRVLRNASGAFSGYSDPGASVIHDGTDLVVTDTSALINGQVYYYGLFWFDGSAWSADGINHITPNPTMVQLGTDVLSVVRERLDAGLLVFVSKGELHHKQGHIQVLTSPPLFEDTIWPVVTVHMQSDSSADHAAGGLMGIDGVDSNGLAIEYTGWLSRYQLLIVSWCLNPDERNLLRRAVKNLLIANLPIFDAADMDQIDVTQTDTEDFQSFGAPVYQTMTTLTCLAPSLVGGTDYLVNIGSVSVALTPTI